MRGSCLPGFPILLTLKLRPLARDALKRARLGNCHPVVPLVNELVLCQSLALSLIFLRVVAKVAGD